MRFSLKLSYLLSLLLFSCYTLAAKNPIGWALDASFPSQIISNAPHIITYTLTNNLPFQLVHPLNIQKNASPSSEFTYTDTCTGQRLTPKQSCTVQIKLTPLITGQKFFQLLIAGYDRNVVPLPQLTTLAVGESQIGVSGAVTQALPSSMTLGNSQNYTFTFTNHGSINATNVVSSVMQTSGTLNITSNSCDSLVAQTLSGNGGICTIAGIFTPASSSTQSVSATLTFNGASGSPSSVSTVTNVTVPDSDIVVSVPAPLPPLLAKTTATYPVEFVFTNVTSGTVTLSPPATLTCVYDTNTPCQGGVLTDVVSNCPASLVGLNSSCSVTGTFNTSPASTNETYVLTGALTFTGTGSPASATTQGTVVASLTTTRTITVLNQCNFDVWYSLHGGAVSGYAPPSCPTGTSASGTQCFWQNIAGASGDPLLAQGASDTITIPNLVYNNIQWSGALSASLGCSGSNCLQAGCGNSGGTTPCAAGTGFQQPATQAEFTLQPSGDSYDVEVINGFHIPISMQAFYTTNVPATPDNYTCGTPGNQTAGNGFGGCNWSNAPVSGNGFPGTGYYWVDGVNGVGSACTPDVTTCSTMGQVCGLATETTNDIISITGFFCGNFLGYWTPNQVCAQPNLPSAVTTYFNCNSPLPSSFGAGNPYPTVLATLMQCPTTTGQTSPTYNTCYNSYPGYPLSAIQQCCGCVDWWQSSQTGGMTILANSTATTCPSGQTNSYWTSLVQPGIQWMKKVCPSDYTYPYDDKTSGFSCSNSASSSPPNSADYLITFCPGGNTGLPSGVTEGRS